MNKTTSCSYSVRQIIKYMKNGKFVFDFAIQREPNQWSALQKTLFILSLIQGYDVPDIYIINTQTDNFEKESVLDGMQRLTNIFDYYNDKFKLSNKIDNIRINGNDYDISGKTFSQLPEEVQDEFLDYTIRARKMNGFSDDEIEEQFYRLNNGCTFTNAQKANVKLGTELSKRISVISNGSFFRYKAAFSDKAKKTAETTSCVLQTLMMITDYNYSGMSASEVLKFAQFMNDECKAGNEDYLKAVDYCKHLYSRMYTLLTDVDTGKLLKKIHIPVLIRSLKEAEQLEDSGDITEEVYVNFLKYWLSDGINKDNYKEFCGSGSTKREKVDKRINVIISELYDYITQ